MCLLLGFKFMYQAWENLVQAFSELTRLTYLLSFVFPKNFTPGDAHCFGQLKNYFFNCLGFYSVIKLPMLFDPFLNQFSTMPTTRVSHNPIDHPVNKSCTFQAISSLGRRPPTKPQKLSSFSPFWRKLNICWGSLVSLWLHWRERGVEEGGRRGRGGVAGECVGQSEEWNWQEAHTLLLQTGLLPPPIPLSSPQNNVQTGF